MKFMLLIYVDDAIIKSGTEFTSNHVPGVNWEPLDIAARVAFKARFAPAAVADDVPQAEAAPKKRAKAKAPRKAKAAAKKAEAAAETAVAADAEAKPKPDATDEPAGLDQQKF